MEFAAGKHRLQQVACIHGAFGLSCADDGMKLIDEEDDSAVAFFDFVQNSFQALLKFASELCTCNKRTHIKTEHGLVLQSFRYVAAHDTLCESLGDGGFTYARFADKYGVVFGFT